MTPRRPFIKTYGPAEAVPVGITMPRQVHGVRIVEIVTGTEDLTECDGLWTCRPDVLLGVQTADCAAVALWDRMRVGIMHIGWRGLVADGLDRMRDVFDRACVWIGPLLPAFKIQRDFCHEAVVRRFGHEFIEECDGALVFQFRSALRAVAPEAVFDPRSTADTPHLASWRRDQSAARNITVIGMEEPCS